MSQSLFIIVIFFIFCSITSAQNDSDVIVQTDLGKVRGKVLKTRLGNEFFAFRGIRYGKAPVDDLRFKNPVPVEKWGDSIYDATTDGPMCPQRTHDETDISEDCLRLNVYTRNLPSYNGNDSKPVLMYLHPGGFYSVSGQSKNFAGPQLLMDRDIVLVTLNYRLSSLGFLAAGIPEAPGNAGLKDQVLALRWIKNHIKGFGGDPNSVTLMGYSAGGMSVTLHMISPMSKDLFHKVIAMSGSAIAQWEIPSKQLDLVERQAKLLQCNVNGTLEDTVNCLRSRDFKEFANTVPKMFEFGSGSPIILWKPVVESDFGQERFLTEDPVKLFQEGKFMKVPIISGMTKDEFTYTAIRVLQDDALRSEMDLNFNEISPICFLYERNTERSHEITREFQSVFLRNESLSLEKSIPGLGALFSDGVIGFGVHRFVHLASRYTPIHYYRFSYKGRFSHFYYPDDKPYGVVHHDDLLYLFAVPGITPLFTANDPEHVTIERLTRLWTNFALNGDPNKPNDEYLKEVRWRPFSFRKESYLDIGNELVMKEGLYTERFSVWKRLFPLTWVRRSARVMPSSSLEEDFSEDYPMINE